MAEPAPMDIESYSAAYLRGELTTIEQRELRNAMNTEGWRELVQRRYRFVQQHKLEAIKAKTREQLDLSDVCALLVMLIEKP